MFLRSLSPVSGTLYRVAKALARRWLQRRLSCFAAAFGRCGGKRVDIAEAGADHRELGGAKNREVCAAGHGDRAPESAGQEAAEIAVVAESAVDGDRPGQRRCL